MWNKLCLSVPMLSRITYVRLQLQQGTCNTQEVVLEPGKTNELPLLVSYSYKTDDVLRALSNSSICTEMIEARTNPWYIKKITMERNTDSGNGIQLMFRTEEE